MKMICVLAALMTLCVAGHAFAEDTATGFCQVGETLPGEFPLAESPKKTGKFEAR